MNGFKQLLMAYLAAHPNILPPADPGEEVCFESNGLEWKVWVRNSGELSYTTVECEDLLGWLWLQQLGQHQA